MKDSYTYAIALIYYIVCSLICYSIIDSILFCMIIPIILPISLVIFIGIVYFGFLLSAVGMQYLNKCFQSTRVYITVKPILAIIYILITYTIFCFLFSFIFFKHNFIICPENTNYYHWNLECNYLPNDFYPNDEGTEESFVFIALLEGRKPCNGCVDYNEDIKSLKYTFVAYCILYLLFVGIEYLYRNKLLPSLDSIKLFFKNIIGRK